MVFLFIASMAHHYPCDDWLTEHSCAECRQIADEEKYFTEELAARNIRRQKLGLPPLVEDWRI